MFMCVYKGIELCMHVGSPTLSLAILFPESVAVLAATISQDPPVDAP